MMNDVSRENDGAEDLGFVSVKAKARVQSEPINYWENRGDAQ